VLRVLANKSKNSKRSSRKKAQDTKIGTSASKIIFTAAHLVGESAAQPEINLSLSF
jgi:hypothetical protein